MNVNRREMLAASLALGAAWSSGQVGAQTAIRKQAMGVVIHSYGIRQGVSRRRSDKPGFDDPLVFLNHCIGIGAGGIQTSLGIREPEYVKQLRARAESAGAYLEGSIRLPQARGDVERFTAEVRTAKAAGAQVLRTVALSGRRYETFDSAAAFDQFAKQAYQSLTLAEPVVAREKVRLAVENHKDWRVDELLDLLKRLASRQVGVCVDTGNSIALLEGPLEVAEAYAPWAFTTHIKDMGVAGYEDGFLLSEVPLGTGFLDLKKIVQILRQAQPGIHFNLEMITRDPLKVPCLTPKYWATFEKLPGRHLAEALVRVQKHASREPLPRVAQLTPDKQLEAEDSNVRRCLAWAREHLDL